MKYFAYGSNMLLERVLARVPDATVLGAASVTGRRLRFDKCSKDGSGKCNIPEVNDPTAIVHGVLFEVPEHQLPALNRAEGEGYGYEQTTIDVSFAGSATPALVYLAQADHTNSQLSPYDWYHDLVVAGARQNSLPAAYVLSIAAVKAKFDPEPTRKTRIEAIELLKTAKAAVGPGT
jgi:gamma-glutamylcyclotransferase